MTNTRLRLTPSEFGALWTYFIGLSKVDDIINLGHVPMATPQRFIESNSIQLIEEYNPDFRPRWENGKLTVDPLFRTWVDCLGEDDPLLEALR